MTPVPLHGHYGRPRGIDLCSACHSAWFDEREDLSLAPGAVVLSVDARLIKYVNCGANTDIRAHADCQYCHAPIAVLTLFASCRRRARGSSTDNRASCRACAASRS